MGIFCKTTNTEAQMKPKATCGIVQQTEHAEKQKSPPEFFYKFMQRYSGFRVMATMN